MRVDESLRRRRLLGLSLSPPCGFLGDFHFVLLEGCFYWFFLVLCLDNRWRIGYH